MPGPDDTTRPGPPHFPTSPQPGGATAHGDHGPGEPDNDLIIQGADDPVVDAEPQDDDNQVAPPADGPESTPSADIPESIEPETKDSDLDPEDTHNSEGEPRNRMVAENGTDLDAASDTTQHRQGNALGLSRDAAENFRKMYRQEAERLRDLAEKADEEADKYDEKLRDMDGPQENDPSDDAGVQKDKDS